MSRVKIKPTYQIQRINQLQNRLLELRAVESKQLRKRPHSKAWSCLEVIEHMIVAQASYNDKMNEALAKSKSADGNMDVIRTRAIPSYLIKRFPPQEGKIRFKMKTTKQFKPMLDNEKLTQENVTELLEKMSKSLDQLVAWVEQTRKKDVLPIRFNSAIGPLVRFNASEACEFILCHNERHFQQIANVLSAVNE